MTDSVCKLFFVGDVVLNRSTNAREVFDLAVGDFIRKHDLACCNFEAPVEFERGGGSS